MDSRLIALLEVGFIFILIEIVSMLLYSVLYLPFFKPATVFGGPVYTIIIHLVFTAIILSLLVVTKSDLSQYGLSFRSLGSDLKAVAVCILPIAVFIMIGIVQFPNTRDPVGALLYAAVSVIIILIISKLLTYVTIKNDKISAGRIMLIAVPVIVLPLTGGMVFIGTILVVEFIVDFMFVGPTEELLFRGFMQSRLNTAFGRPVRLFGISWGVGLIIASLLFGLMHVINSQFNPLLGMYNLNWGWGVGTFFIGLTLGIIREKTGNIIAPSILHGLIDFVLAISAFMI